MLGAGAASPQLEQGTLKRYCDARSRKNYAGTSPITKALGKHRVVLARHVRNNRRLADVCYLWAFAALTASPGTGVYDRRRSAGDTHHRAFEPSPTVSSVSFTAASGRVVYGATAATVGQPYLPPVHGVVEIEVTILSSLAVAPSAQDVRATRWRRRSVALALSRLYSTGPAAAAVRVNSETKASWQHEHPRPPLVAYRW